MRRGRGWFNNPIKHSLASRGVSTSIRNRNSNFDINPNFISLSLEKNKYTFGEVKVNTSPRSIIYYDYTLLASGTIDREMPSSIVITKRPSGRYYVESVIRLPLYDGVGKARKKLNKLKQKVERLNPDMIDEWETKDFHKDIHVEGDWVGGHVKFDKVIDNEEELRMFIHDYNIAIEMVLKDE